MPWVISSDCLYEEHTNAANRSPLVLALLNVADEAQSNESRRRSYTSTHSSGDDRPNRPRLPQNEMEPQCKLYRRVDSL